jgi:hypothetical protein
VSEDVLTGESFPVEKPGKVAAGTRLAERSNCVFGEVNVRSGTARCRLCKRGRNSVRLRAHRLSLRPPNEFDRGIPLRLPAHSCDADHDSPVFAVPMFRTAPVETFYSRWLWLWG